MCDALFIVVALILFGGAVIFAVSLERLRDEQPSMPAEKALEHDVERVSTYEPPPAAPCGHRAVHSHECARRP